MNLKLELPLDQWQMVMRHLLAAPYVHVRDIIASLEAQTRKAGEDEARTRVDASLRADELAQKFAQAQRTVQDMDLRASDQERVIRALEATNERLREEVRKLKQRQAAAAANGEAPKRKRGRPRKQRDVEEQAEVAEAPA